MMAKVRCKQQTVHEIKLPMAMMLLVFMLIHRVLEEVDEDAEG
jgi:hypothetical protein